MCRVGAVPSRSPGDSCLPAAMGQDRGLAGANAAELQGTAGAIPCPVSLPQSHQPSGAVRPPDTCSRCWRVAPGWQGSAGGRCSPAAAVAACGLLWWVWGVFLKARFS